MTLTPNLIEHTGLSIDENGQRTYTSLYRVISDTPHPHPLAVCQSLGIISNVTSFPGDPESVATAFNYKSAGGEGETLGTVFNVTVTYSPRVNSSAANIDATPTKRWRKEPVTRPYTRDAEGVAVVNSAGMPPNDPFTAEYTTDVLNITRTEPDLRYQGMTDFINANTFEGKAPGTVLCAGFESEEIYDSAFAGGKYYRVSYEFRVKPEGWDVEYQDMGTYEKVLKEKENPSDPDEYELKAITDDDGNPVSEPHLLDGNGRKLPVGAPIVWRKVRPYKRATFNFGFV